jgi:Flp pilus assembly protein TadG
MPARLQPQRRKATFVEVAFKETDKPAALAAGGRRETKARPPQAVTLTIAAAVCQTIRIHRHGQRKINSRRLLREFGKLRLGWAMLRVFMHRFLRNQSGNVAVIFALCLVPMLFLAGMALDYASATQRRVRLNAAADAAALAAVTPSMMSQSDSAAKTAARNIFMAAASTMTGLKHAIPKVVIATSGFTRTATVSYTAASVNSFPNILGQSTWAISGSSTATAGATGYVQLNLVLDSSGSMIVGATDNDVSTIAKWVSNNWSKVKPLDPAPNYPDGDTPPCAFACHDVGDQTTASDMKQGLQNAHTAGATTRFDVMIAAAQQLISHVQSESSYPQYHGTTFLFNILSFDTTLHQWGGQNLGFSAATSALDSASPGLDTHMSTALSSLITQIGTQGNGSSPSSPWKFVIMITDGLQSDRNGNWQHCTYWGYDPVWNWHSQCYGDTSPYPGLISADQCNQIKNTNIIFSILETPYVPLTGEDPGETPYESDVRKFIYPKGPDTSSVVSAALQACASPGYYYQATDSTQIAAGFTNLTDKFLGTAAYLSK